METRIQETTQSLLDHVRNTDNQANESRPPTIYMAPSLLRAVSPSSFDPRVVSIGPLHRQDANVQAFEKHKASFMIKLMSRILDSPHDEILKSCMQKVYSSMDRIKECYVSMAPYDEDDAAIAKMMVLDACFILEYINQVSESPKELFHGNITLRNNVAYDLVLLENQIPFFFLQEIFECTILKFKPDVSLIQLLRPVVLCIGPFKVENWVNLNNRNISTTTTDHILSLLHQYYEPPLGNTISSQYFLTKRIQSAIDLHRAGVNFKPNQNPTWMMEMKVELTSFTCFCWSWCKPTFKMPILNIYDSTESKLRNLIAYEQSFPTGSYVTSYAYAMDMLVNTHEDVAKLVESGVFVNYMGSNKEAANMINNICKHVQYIHIFYDEWTTLNRYCDGYWPKNIAWLRSNYFNSPWNMIALLAGILLFALTAIQTIFTVKSSMTSGQH